MTLIGTKQTLTRSVVVICSSRYLQHPTLTSDIMRKHYNHLIPNFIVTRSLGQPHPTLQILRRTSLLPGQFPANKRDSRPVSCAGNTNYHNCRTVSVNNGRRVIMINCTLYTYSLAPRWFAFITG